MKTTEISRADWTEFFDRVTDTLQGKRIDIEIDAPDIGAQVEARKLSLNGLGYDRRDDVFVIDTEVIEHLVRAPQQIYVSGDEDAVDSLEITVADGGKHIISFSEPLALPLPGSAA
ncbi:MAG TPA: DUF5335 family protein [Gammaproteobacteria bacterium]|nr:DUF5335 family protein [Gammaproteobacteria bacterium]